MNWKSHLGKLKEGTCHLTIFPLCVIGGGGGENPNMIWIGNFALSRFHEAPFLANSQNCITFHKIQNKFEKKYLCYGNEFKDTGSQHTYSNGDLWL